MNYRHAYHAGNFADVFKHALLAMCLEYLKGKDKPFFVLDTHSGVGLYDLEGVEAGKTGEWRDGIARVIDAPDAPAELAPYLEIVRGLNPGGGLRAYPGSPWVAKALARPDDRIALCELHPADAETLADTLRGDRRVKVYARDGYGAVKALLPPPERRGLVLIDPPFEKRDEFAALEQAVRDGVKRFAGGTFALWYPIKDAVEIAAFHARLEDLGVPKTLSIDLFVRRPRPGLPRLDGCGYVFINPPYGLLAGLDRVMPFLAGLLAQDGGAGWTRRWLVPET
ncbi:23S rRNA (adenine(2030)-N(6))-methyltransferase RlmJ [Novispirillum sp. DQ9]|uniref:23S rRNA (adenine(2030)-N(6))-methyltransferase RlmJ n=1 Tax=Novispirillum sp. DQ9 TaxID=3398612 RepID=UPI003C79F0AD